MLTSRGGKTDLAPFLNSFSSGVPHSGLEAFDHAALSAAQLEIPPQLQTSAHVQPWNPTHLKQDGGAMFVIEDINPSRRSPSSSFSASVSPRQPASPQSPNIKQESAGGSSSRAPIPIRRVKNARVEKKKSSSSSASPSSDPLGGGSKFVIVTPTSINAHAGKHNPFECFEAMRTTQKGRKGPLANDTKENALQVRRLGACFCCHARKVKCDAERPCRNCKKLAVNVPQVVCWQFQDFLTVLFPEFIRGHFKKDEMARFVADNIQAFTVDGAEKPCAVELFSGVRFGATLNIRAKFFTAKTSEVLQHWHMKVDGSELVMESKGAAPIGLELDTAAQRDELRKKTKEYIHLLTQEPAYADQLTDSLTHTELPRKVLTIVQRYARQSEVSIRPQVLQTTPYLRWKESGDTYTYIYNYISLLLSSHGFSSQEKEKKKKEANTKPTVPHRQESPLHLRHALRPDAAPLPDAAEHPQPATYQASAAADTLGYAAGAEPADQGGGG